MTKNIQIWYSQDEVSDFVRFNTLAEHNKLIISMINEAHRMIYEGQEGRWVERENDNGYKYYGIAEYSENNDIYWGMNNRLNTNYTALTHLTKKLNNLLIQNNITDIIVFNGDNDHDYNELIKMRRYLLEEDAYRDILLSDKFECYYEIRSICEETWRIGKKYSKDFINNCTNYLDWVIRVEANDDLPGDPVDMFGGIDCYVVYTGKTYIHYERKAGVQVKKVTSVSLRDDGLYYVKVGIRPDKYKFAKLFAFYENLNSLYVFKNEVGKLKQIYEGKSSYVTIPKDLLIYPKK